MSALKRFLVAVPLVTLLPTVWLRVKFPMLSVPSV